MLTFPETCTVSGLLTYITHRRLRGKNVGNGWTQHCPPHKDFRYFYHQELQLVTDYDMSIDVTRIDFLSKYEPIARANLPLETFVQKATVHTGMTVQGGQAAVVDHEVERTRRGRMMDAQSRASYWTYLHLYPCHHKLPGDAEK